MSECLEVSGVCEVTEQGKCLNTSRVFSNALGLSVSEGTRICKYFVIRVYECLEKVSKVLLSV